MQDLERDAALVPEIGSEINCRHSTAAQLAVEMIAREECSLETLMHGCSSRHRLRWFPGEQINEPPIASQSVEIGVMLDPLPVAEAVVYGLAQGGDGFLVL